MALLDDDEGALEGHRRLGEVLTEDDADLLRHVRVVGDGVGLGLLVEDGLIGAADDVDTVHHASVQHHATHLVESAGLAALHLGTEQHVHLLLTGEGSHDGLGALDLIGLGGLLLDTGCGNGGHLGLCVDV